MGPVTVDRRPLDGDGPYRDPPHRGLSRPRTEGTSMDASSTDAGPVVVGVDPSDCARDAAEWAADLAAMWGVSLHLVHAVPDDRPMLVPRWLDELLGAAERAGAEPSQAKVRPGAVVDVLAHHSAGARMLVLGSYGEGARSGMLAGSVALALLGHTNCPVAVVRGPTPQALPPRSGPVVVGVDGSVPGRGAVEFAAGLAVSLAAPLVAVHTWTDVVTGADGATRRRLEAPAALAAEGAALLETELDGVATSHPGLPVDRVVVGDTPVRALLDRAGGARLLVVGHRGHGAGSASRSGMLHGSTSRALVEFAPCPVVVTGSVAAPGAQPTARSAGTAR
jgi:nucleotide-binding universal stress UspA family protein